MISNLYLIEGVDNLKSDITVLAILIKSSAVACIRISLLHSPKSLPRSTSLEILRNF